MTIVYEITLKNTRMTAVMDAVDAGPAGGKLKIYTAAYATLLVTFTFSDPCGAVAGGVLTFSDMPKTEAAVASGIAAIARITDSNDNLVGEGLSVGLGGADIIVDNIGITAGQNVNLLSAKITHG